MAKLKVREYGMKMHMKLDNGHSYVYDGYIDQPGHPMDGKKIIKKMWSPKGGPVEIEYMIADGTDQPPPFKKLVFLMDHYNLKPMEK